MKMFIHRVTQIEISEQKLKVTGQGEVLNLTIHLKDSQGNEYEIDTFPTEDHHLIISNEVLAHAAQTKD